MDRPKKIPKYKMFQQGNFAYCDKHGFHSNWYVAVWHGSSKISCKTCKAEDRKAKYAKGLIYKKKAQEDLQRVVKGTMKECRVHGTHDNWSYRRYDDRVVCRPCHNVRSLRSARKDFWKTKIKKAKSGAKRRGFSFDLIPEDLKTLFDKQEARCALTNLPFDLENEAHLISIDRIDSNIGYEIGNVWLVHRQVNLMKGASSLDDFIHFCGKVTKTHGRPIETN
jgi:hypothetical protein